MERLPYNETSQKFVRTFNSIVLYKLNNPIRATKLVEAFRLFNSLIDNSVFVNYRTMFYCARLWLLFDVPEYELIIKVFRHCLYKAAYLVAVQICNSIELDRQSSLVVLQPRVTFLDTNLAFIVYDNSEYREFLRTCKYVRPIRKYSAPCDNFYL